MLNNFWIGLGTGVIIGAGGAYLILKKVFSDEYEKKVSEELEESRRVYRSQMAPIPSIEEIVEEKENMNNIPEPEPVEEQAEETEEEDEEYDEAEELYPRDDRITEPYEIEPNVFLTDQRYEKCTCFWYEDDDLLVTEDDEILDMGKTVGQYIDEMFGNYLPETAYIRNELLGYDYEVIRKKTGYYSDY